MTHLEAFATYNAGVRRAVRAHREDRMHADGICVRCERRRSGDSSRVCSACRQQMKRGREVAT
jgi:hypothetical protein